jgi:hypothetical protein
MSRVSWSKQGASLLALKDTLEARVIRDADRYIGSFSAAEALIKGYKESEVDSLTTSKSD